MLSIALLPAHLISDHQGHTGSIVLKYWGPNPWIMLNYPLFIIKLDYLKDILNIVYFVNDEVPTVKIHRVCGIITIENIS